jgi:hypothetical protein
MITIQAEAAVAVPAPPAGKYRLFVDSSDSFILKVKNSANVSTPFGVGTAAELGTTGSPVVVDASAPPAGAGEVLVSLTPTTAEWQTAAEAKLNTPVVQDPVVYDNGDSPVTALWGVLYRIDLSLGSVTVNLPTAIGNTDRMIAVKIIGATFGNTVTVDAFGAQTIEGALTFVLNTPGELFVVRSAGLVDLMEWS